MNKEIELIIGKPASGKTCLLSLLGSIYKHNGKNVLFIFFEESENRIRNLNKRAEDFIHQGSKISKETKEITLKKFSHENEIYFYDVANYIYDEMCNGNNFDVILIDDIPNILPNKVYMESPEKQRIFFNYIEIAKLFNITTFATINTIDNDIEKFRGDTNISNEIFVESIESKKILRLNCLLDFIYELKHKN